MANSNRISQKFLLSPIVDIDIAEARKILSTGEILESDGLQTELSQMICQSASYDCKYYISEALKYADLKTDFYLEEAVYNYVSYPYSHSCITFVTRRPDYITKSFQFIRVFNLNVWLSILIAMMATSLFYHFLFHRRISVLMSFFYTWNTLFGQYHDWKPKSKAQKVLVITWNIGMILISGCYCSILLSKFAEPFKEESIKDFDELYDQLHKGKVKVAESQFLPVHGMLLQSENAKLKFIGEKLEKNPKVNIFTVHKLLYEENLVVVSPNYAMKTYFTDEFYTSNDCVSLGFYSVWVSNRLNKSKIDKAVHKIAAGGLMEKILDHWHFKRKLQVIKRMKRPVQREIVRPLSLFDLSGPFIILIFGNVLGIICLFFELCTKCKSK